MIDRRLLVRIERHVNPYALFRSVFHALHPALSVKEIIFRRSIKHKLYRDRCFIFQFFGQFQLLYPDHRAILAQRFVAGKDIQIFVRPGQICAVAQIGNFPNCACRAVFRAVLQQFADHRVAFFIARIRLNVVHLLHLRQFFRCRHPRIIDDRPHIRHLVSHKQAVFIRIRLLEPERLTTRIQRFIHAYAFFIQRAIQFRIAFVGGLLRQPSKNAQPRRNRRAGQRQDQNHRCRQPDGHLSLYTHSIRAVLRQRVEGCANCAIKRIVSRRIHRLKFPL